jgi:hypothetical protein
MKRKLLSIVIVFWGIQLRAQTPSKGLRPATLITASLAFQNNWGYLNDRYGSNLSIGAGVGYKTQSNWVFSGEASYMFGSNVKNGGLILNQLIGEKGYVFNQTGNYAELNLFQRGIYGHFTVEKILPLIQLSENSGPTIGLGAGYLCHWIRLNNVGNDAPQVLGEYYKGYDRLSGGFSLKESIGYLYLSKKEGVNFKLSFELMQGFTKSLRGFNYDTGMIDEETRLDLFYNIRLNWYLPIYKKARTEYYID